MATQTTIDQQKNILESGGVKNGKNSDSKKKGGKKYTVSLVVPSKCIGD